MLIPREITSPVPFTVQPDIPVAQVLNDKFLNGPAGLGRFVITELLIHLLDQGVQQGNDPPVYLRSLAEGYYLFFEMESIDIGIEGKK